MKKYRCTGSTRIFLYLHLSRPLSCNEAGHRSATRTRATSMPKVTAIRVCRLNLCHTWCITRTVHPFRTARLVRHPPSGRSSQISTASEQLKAKPDLVSLTLDCTHKGPSLSTTSLWDIFEVVLSGYDILTGLPATRRVPPGTPSLNGIL